MFNSQTNKMDLWQQASGEDPSWFIHLLLKTRQNCLDFTWFDDTLHFCHLYLSHYICCHASQCVYWHISKDYLICARFRGSIWLVIDAVWVLSYTYWWVVKPCKISCSVLQTTHWDEVSNHDDWQVGIKRLNWITVNTTSSALIAEGKIKQQCDQIPESNRQIKDSVSISTDESL